MWILRSIFDHFDIDLSDWREVGVVVVGGLLLLAVLAGALILRWVIYRLEHPNSPFWIW